MAYLDMTCGLGMPEISWAAEGILGPTAPKAEQKRQAGSLVHTDFEICRFRMCPGCNCR